MTGVFDRLRVGTAAPPANAAAQVPPQSGAPTSPMFIYSTQPIGASSNKIALAQTVSGTTFTLTAGSGTSLVTIPPVGGTQYIDLGGARVLQAVGRSASAAATAIVINGLEEMVLSDGTLGAGAAMSEQITGPVGNGVSVLGNKAFRYIAYPNGVRASGNTVSSVEIGIVDRVGFPIAVRDGGDIDIFWNGVPITVSTGLTLADTTSPATTTTGDVRGTWPLASAAQGTRRLTAWIYVRNADTYVGVYGQAPQV